MVEEAIQSNYLRVIDRINEAAFSSRRDPQSIRLVVVTKAHPVEMAQAAVKAGARLLGENYVEEAEEKIPSFSAEHRVEWHMIGHIQSRKAHRVCELFHYVHTLDSLKLANRLDRFAGELGKRMPVLMECNVSGEESKSGFPAWDPNQWPSLAEEVRQISLLPNLELNGLMTMAPYFDEPEPARPFFRRLVHLRDYLAEELPQVSLNELSMGMSGDFEVAIQEGATIVRIGTAILGQRQV